MFSVNHTEAFFDHPLEVDPPPVHNAVDGRIGAHLDNLGQLAHLGVGELFGTAGMRMVCQTFRAVCIEAVGPVPSV